MAQKQTYIYFVHYQRGSPPKEVVHYQAFIRTDFRVCKPRDIISLTQNLRAFVKDDKAIILSIYELEDDGSDITKLSALL